MGKNKKKKINKKLVVNPELKGLDVEIDELGQIRSTLDIDKINDFLDHSVRDKKLRNRKSKEEET